MKHMIRAPGDGYVYWDRGEDMQVTKNFTLREFECRCNQCKEQKLNMDLVKRLQRTRDLVGGPIRITSGYRCTDHQVALFQRGISTVLTSQHTKGNAADVKPITFDKKVLDRYLDSAFMATGISRSFTHVDTRRDKERRWCYQD